MEHLEEAVLNYKETIENIPSEGFIKKSSAEDRAAYQPTVLSVLIARQNIAYMLNNYPVIPAELKELTKVDQYLRTKAKTIELIAGKDIFEWRKTFQPPGSAWWWFLDEYLNPSPLWDLLTTALLFIAIGLAVEISLRFLSSGADFWGVSQLVLAMLLAGSITKSGRELAQRIANRLRIKHRFQAIWNTGIIFFFVVALLILKIELPDIARVYNQKALHEQQQGLVMSALKNYQKAIRLNPDFAAAHYNLGTTYEDILEYEKAMSEYQTALKIDPNLIRAYNNLARLYILHDKNFANALLLLNSAFLLAEKQNEILSPFDHYTLYKNRGWASYGLKDFDSAEADLREALKINSEGAAAHCLLAQLLDAQKKGDKAKSEWEECIAWEAPGEYVEAEWLVLSQQRLKEGGQK